jgi:hypothetical protein
VTEQATLLVCILIAELAAIGVLAVQVAFEQRRGRTRRAGRLPGLGRDIGRFLPQLRPGHNSDGTAPAALFGHDRRSPERRRHNGEGVA